MKLGNGREIGRGHPAYIIAEIGINHNGDMELCEHLIDAAKASGADAVKFQKRTIDVVYTPDELAAPRQSRFGTTNGDLKRGLEFGQEQYDRIAAKCKAVGIDWSASCWDVGSVNFLSQYNVPWHKVAGPCATDMTLLAELSVSGKPVMLSTGMSSEQELIAAAVRIVKYGVPCIPMHCVSSYPTRPQDAALKEMIGGSMRQAQHALYDYGITDPWCYGYSGHELGYAITLAAVTLGACVIERHFTIDKTLWGSDQAWSLEPAEFAAMVRGIREIEAAMASEERRSAAYPCERPAWEKLRRYKHAS